MQFLFWRSNTLSPARSFLIIIVKSYSWYVLESVSGWGNGSFVKSSYILIRGKNEEFWNPSSKHFPLAFAKNSIFKMLNETILLRPGLVSDCSQDLWSLKLIFWSSSWHVTWWHLKNAWKQYRGRSARFPISETPFVIRQVIVLFVTVRNLLDTFQN